MLIEFTVGNYRSFKDNVTFSMVAANMDGNDEELDENNVFAVDNNLSLLKSAAIYGANASGKSNLVQALRFMKKFMINSSRETQSIDKIDVENFKLSTETENKPSFFEIVFLLDKKQYRYGFEVDQDRVVSEGLFYVPNVKETVLFTRENGQIKSAKKYNADGLEKRTRHNALFLSVSAQFNVDIAEKILHWLTNNLIIASGLSDIQFLSYTLDCLEQGHNIYEIITLIKKLDLGINEIKIDIMTVESLPDDIPDKIKEFLLKETTGKGISIQTEHDKFDDDGNHVSTEFFDMNEQESDGTQKIFAMSGMLVDTLKNGKILIFDEFDARLHPLISRAIIEFFNSNTTNSKNAQLILMTHDTNLLSKEFFRRDQIWFTEKNKFGATDLYSLAEYELDDDSFEKDYIKGKYGAIPYIGNLQNLIDFNEQKHG